MSSYLKWLQVLIALGPKLPKILAAFQALMDAIGEAFPPAEPAEGTLQLVTVTDEEAAAEAQVFALVVGEGSLAIGDGGRLRGLFKFLKDSGLLDIAMGFLLKKVAGG